MSRGALLGWLRNWTGVSPVVALFVLSLIGLPVMLVHTVQTQVRKESLESARAVSELMLQFRRYYNLNIVSRLQQGDHPPTVTESYQGIRGAIPIPATMSIELAELLSRKLPNSIFDFSFVSDHPFRGRDRPALDAFQREALAAFRSQPDLEEFWREEAPVAGGSHVRLAIPVKMQKACVDCHNHHPDSTFRSWKVGDVRGVQDVTVRLIVSPGRLDNFVYLGAYLIVFVVLLVLALNEYRRSNYRLLALNAELSRNRQQLEDQRGQLQRQMDELVTKTEVLDRAPFGIVIANPLEADLPIVYVNESFTRITGYAPEDILGRNCRVLQGPDTDPGALEQIRRSLQEHRYVDLELVNYRRDGSPFQNRLQLFPCFNAKGDLVSYAACTTDVTDLKLAQAEREQFAAELQESMKLQSLGLAIAGIAHDINTPIGVALTASTHLASKLRQLAASSDGSGTPAESAAASLLKSAELIANNLHKAAGLVRSFKQTTADASRVDWRKVPLRPFFDSLLLAVSPLMRRARCEVRLHCPAEAEMFTDPGSLGQVITNLMVNASIHAFEGREHRTVDISVQIDDTTVRIEVADNGNGMTQEALSKAFVPFFTTRRGAGGSGLGLFSARRVVEELLGGRITVQSQPGVGTTFSILLPRKHDPSPAPAAGQRT